MFRHSCFNRSAFPKSKVLYNCATVSFQCRYSTAKSLLFRKRIRKDYRDRGSTDHAFGTQVRSIAGHGLQESTADDIKGNAFVVEKLLKDSYRKPPDSADEKRYSTVSIYVFNKLKDRRKWFEFDYEWLRDSCRCSECVHPVTGQKLVDIFSIPSRLRVKDVRYDETQSSVHITWDDAKMHHSVYPLSWLLGKRHPTTLKDSSLRPKLWTSDIKANLPSILYEYIMSSETGVKDWCKLIQVHGFCFIDKCPPNPAATKALLERISFIRETHYGGFYDFTSNLASKDMAYTSLPLDLHTDNTYFTDPSGLQMFHLLSHTNGSGGETLLADGFSVARDFESMYPLEYASLSKTLVPAHASGNENVSIRPTHKFPVLNHYPESKKLFQIRWNNSDRGTFTGITNLRVRAEISAWYEGARCWKKLLEQDKYVLKLQMTPERPLIFNNWRVLHGRTEFSGNRRICGGYINHDDFISRLELLTFGRKATLESV